MSKQKTQDGWTRDIQARQRNLVFPDTVNNEARFWRNILSAKQRLTWVHGVGILIVLLTVAAMFFAFTFLDNLPFTRESSWVKLFDAGVKWLLAFGLIALILIAFRITQRNQRK